MPWTVQDTVNPWSSNFYFQLRKQAEESFPSRENSKPRGVTKPQQFRSLGNHCENPTLSKAMILCWGLCSFPLFTVFMDFGFMIWEVLFYLLSSWLHLKGANIIAWFILVLHFCYKNKMSQVDVLLWSEF